MCQRMYECEIAKCNMQHCKHATPTADYDTQQRVNATQMFVLTLSLTLLLLLLLFLLLLLLLCVVVANVVLLLLLLPLAVVLLT